MPVNWTDPESLEGDALRRWYLRSPAEVEQERQAAADRRYQDFFYGASGTDPDSRFDRGPSESARRVDADFAVSLPTISREVDPAFAWIQAGPNRWRSVRTANDTQSPDASSAATKSYGARTSSAAISKRSATTPSSSETSPSGPFVRSPATPLPAPAHKSGSPVAMASRMEVGQRGTSAAPKPPSVDHPGFAESLIPVWGSGREAVADFQEGNYTGAALNGALAVSDLFLAESIAKGLAKGGFYVVKNVAKEAPYAWKTEVRPWMGKQGFLEPGQHGHHWAIPQKGWGKNVPDAIKNQPWNIKPMPDATTHWRLEHRVGDLPRFNPIERYWYGTPAWSKVATGALVGHPVAAATARSDRSK